MTTYKESEVTLVMRTRWMQNFKQKLQAKHPKLKIITCETEKELLSAIPRADILFIGFSPNLIRGSLLEELLKEVPKLKWIQITESGADGLIRALLVQKKKIEVTCMRGTHGDVMSEYVLCVIMMFLRNFPQYLKNQEKRIWEQRRAETMKGKTILILGLGQIGRVLAKRVKFFEAVVIGVDLDETKIDGVDKQVTPSCLLDVLPDADFVCIHVPLTPETLGLIKEKELKAMKKTAFLINTARGGIVDIEALTRALKENWIAGAALDVFTTEPLPPSSEIWGLPNLIVTPHIAGALSEEGYVQRRVEIFSDNLKRFFEGEELINVIDQSRGF